MASGSPEKFFHFFRKEHSGALVVLFGAIILAFLPRWWLNSSPPKKLGFAQDSIAIQQLIAESKLRSDSLRKQYYKKRSLYKSSEDDLVAMGFDAQTARKIKAQMSHGGFKNLQQLSQISGMDTQKIKTMFYVGSIGSKYTNEKQPKFGPSNPLDINEADSLDLMSLTGIGAKSAHRILRYREVLGGFYSTLQLKEIKGLDSNTIKLLFNSFKANPLDVQKIDLYNLTEIQLSSHPYISFKQAKQIKAYIKQHGKFDAGDLQKHPAFTPQEKQRLQNYL